MTQCVITVLVSVVLVETLRMFPSESPSVEDIVNILRAGSFYSRER